ncbi:MAG: efflux RND transporter permease subunit, partial [Congregibacter sp.]|nr:efflux RND transporter permease subunit [Congregibacter sp.]
MLAKLLYTHNRYLWLTVLVILMVGVASLRSLGRQEDPTITNFVATVTTFFPGAEPARIEALVSKPIEEELRGIAEVDEVKSTSSTGVSSIVIELYDTLDRGQIERAWSEVRDALDDASRQFPAGVAAPVFDNDRTTAYVRIIALTSAPGYALSVPLLSRSADDLAERIRNFFGTQFVDVYGEASEEIRVDINEQALLARGISIPELTQALRGADPRRASGRASGDRNDLLIEIDGEFDSAARVAAVIIRTDSSGNSVSVGDIARVYRAEQ